VVFFQAEDGIRGKLVTGVQTCALPIYDERRRHPPGEGVYGSWSALARWAPFGSCGGRVRRVDGGDARHRQLPPLSDLVADVHHRSEERRVGIESTTRVVRFSAPTDRAR